MWTGKFLFGPHASHTCSCDCVFSEGHRWRSSVVPNYRRITTRAVHTKASK